MERIICAATYVPILKKVFYGHRHNHSNEAAYGVLSWTMNRQEIMEVEKIQGFITNEGRFVDRIEGAKIADAANQTIAITGSKNTLYSEDLY